jgi:2-haloacid dehalogenase
MKLTDFKALTFDCYGTLIDWETGIWNALQPLLCQVGLDIERENALAAFGLYEMAQQEQTPSLRYCDLLSVVHARLAKVWGAASMRS